MTIHDDQNRPRPPYTEPVVNRDPARESSGMGWGIPLAVAAVVIIGGFLFMNSGSDRTTTASNTPTTTSQTNPSGPARTDPAPVPAPTPPAKSQ